MIATITIIAVRPSDAARAIESISIDVMNAFSKYESRARLTVIIKIDVTVSFKKLISFLTVFGLDTKAFVVCVEQKLCVFNEKH